MASFSVMVLTGAQVRAARALLRWSAEELAGFSRLGIATIRRAEANDGPVSSTPANMQAIINVFENAGVEFIHENGGGSGVRFRKRRDAVQISHDAR